MSAILDDDPFIVLGPNGPSPAAQSRPAGPCRAGMVSTRSGPALLSPALPKQNDLETRLRAKSRLADDRAAACRSAVRLPGAARDLPLGPGGREAAVAHLPRSRSRQPITHLAFRCWLPRRCERCTIQVRRRPLVSNCSSVSCSTPRAMCALVITVAVCARCEAERSASPGSGLVPSPAPRRSRTANRIPVRTYPPFGGRQFKGEREWSQ